MALKVKRLIKIMEELAPASLASDWDNTGLQAGHPEKSVSLVLVTLDINGSVVEEAVSLGADAIITHHPLIFKPLSTLRADKPAGALLSALISGDIAVIAAHTNLDAAAGGVSDALAGLLELENTAVLRRTAVESLFKLTVFVPAEALEAVREAISSAGAGHIGNYSHCTFSASGSGTFKPLAGADPWLGRPGELEIVDEYRLETVVPASILDRVTAAMIKAHPYEEVAYDVIHLKQAGAESGLGRYGMLREETSLGDIAGHIRGLLEVDCLRMVGASECRVRRVAVCGGSGGSLIAASAERQVDLLLTGDIGYHDAQLADALGLAIIDAGHAATERPVLKEVASYLKGRLAGEADVVISGSLTDPVKFVF